jgi:hypothetical protein
MGVDRKDSALVAETSQSVLPWNESAATSPIKLGRFAFGSRERLRFRLRLFQCPVRKQPQCVVPKSRRQSHGQEPCRWRPVRIEPLKRGSLGILHLQLLSLPVPK